jgi:hypothetical protein
MPDLLLRKGYSLRGIRGRRRSGKSKDVADMGAGVQR